MKKYLIPVLLSLFITSNTNCQSWKNKWFTMEAPGNWRKPEMDYANLPPLKIKGTGVDRYWDIRFTYPLNDKVEGSTISVETCADPKGKRLNYKDFVLKDSITIKEKIIKINNLVCLKRTAIIKVRDKGKPLDHYQTIWYIQGMLRIYIIRYASYNKAKYEANLFAAEKCITSFKEK